MIKACSENILIEYDTITTQTYQDQDRKLYTIVTGIVHSIGGTVGCVKPRDIASFLLSNAYQYERNGKKYYVVNRDNILLKEI
jgi:hypothetical protein